MSNILLLTVIVEALKRSLFQTTAGAVAQQLGRKSAQEGKSSNPRTVELNPTKRQYIASLYCIRAIVLLNSSFKIGYL